MYPWAWTSNVKALGPYIMGNAGALARLEDADVGMAKARWAPSWRQENRLGVCCLLSALSTIVRA